MKNPIEKIVRVTITRTIKIHLDPELMTPEYIEGWRKSLWDINGIDDIAIHAAEMAANNMDGIEHDGLWMLNKIGSTYPKPGDTQFEILDEEFESEIVAE